MLYRVLSGVVIFSSMISGVSAMEENGARETNWTGFYGGVQIGRASNTFSATEDFAAPIYNSFGSSASKKVKGWMGGAHAGMRYQLSHLVFGVEGDLSLTNASDDFLGLNAIDTRTILKAKAFGSARVTAGFTTGRLLFYGTAGKAFLRAKAGVLDANGLPPSANTMDSRRNVTLDGYVFGGGVEFMAVQDWSVKLEYLQTDFGNFNTSGAAGLGGTENWAHELKLKTISLKVSKNF